MASIGNLVFDCAHPASLARFWAAVLDGYDVAPYDEEELVRLRSMGVDDPEDDPSVLVEAPRRVPRLFFQLDPEPKVVKNRLHVDLRADDVDAELERLVSLGATIADDQPNDTLVVLRDIEGNEFCLLR